MTKTIILNFLSAHKTQLEEKFGIQKIGLFGSFRHYYRARIEKEMIYV
ncbi:MAG: hypothetical protein WCW84_00885 [Sulfurimonas sp.]|jgi:predicted nucleotidyltransferase